MDTSRLRLGAFATFATLGFAGIAGLIAVFDADSVSAGFGRGFGIALLVFLAGATLTCALACLSGGRAELVALGSIAAAGLGLDLLVLAIWLEIDSEAYGKITGIAFVWAFFALIALGLTLAIRPQERPAQALYGGAVGAAILASLLATWLIATTGQSEVTEVAGVSVNPADLTDNELLRLLGAVLVVLAALWFAAVAASRLERAPV